MGLAIFFAARLSTNFISPLNQPRAYVISSVTSHLKSNNFYSIRFLFHTKTISSRERALKYCFLYMCFFGCLEPRSKAEWLQLTKLAHIQKTVFERPFPTTQGPGSTDASSNNTSEENALSLLASAANLLSDNSAE